MYVCVCAPASISSFWFGGAKHCPGSWEYLTITESQHSLHCNVSDCWGQTERLKQQVYFFKFWMLVSGSSCWLVLLWTLLGLSMVLPYLCGFRCQVDFVVLKHLPPLGISGTTLEPILKNSFLLHLCASPVSRCNHMLGYRIEGTDKGNSVWVQFNFSPL